MKLSLALLGLQFVTLQLLLLHQSHLGVDGATTTEIHLNETSQVEIEITSQTLTALGLGFRTCRKNGIIAYVAGETDNTFLTVKAVAGFLKLEWNFGDSPGELINYNGAIAEDCSWQQFLISITSTKITFVVDGNEVTFSDSLDAFKPKEDDNLLIGTTDRLESNGVDLVEVTNLQGEESFSGCVRTLIINSQTVDLVSISQVNQHILEYCDEALVLASKTVYSVDSTTALGFNGIEDTFSLWGRRALGLPESSITDEIRFNVRTREKSGVIFFMGRGDSYYLLQLEGRGKIRFEFRLDSKTYGELTASAKINDGEWHSIWILRDGREATLTLDEKSAIQVSVQGAASKMYLYDDFFVGGIKGNHPLPTDFEGEVFPALIGCTQGFTFNGIAMDYDNMDSTAVGVALGCDGRSGVCDKNDCAQQDPKIICTDIWNDYQCDCRMGWSGDLCDENIDDCAAAGPDACNGVGACIDGNNTYSCECDDGWMGERCEMVDRCTPNPCDAGVCSQTSEAYACACEDKYWGRNCSLDCSPGNCNTGKTYTCDQTTGKGLSCEACDAGFYLDSCDAECATIASCISPVTCNQNTGGFPLSCPACVAGHYGSACGSACEVGNCFSQTSVTGCDQADGADVECGKCSNGFFGSPLSGNDCERTCSAPNCATAPICSQAAGDVTDCDGCNINFHGATCDQTCTKGNCDGDVKCDQGDGSNRQCDRCKPGFYGDDCDLTCPTGNCASVASCNKATGLDLTCDTCVGGSWGTDSSGNDCNSVCTSSSCTVVSQCTKLQGTAETCAGCVGSSFKGKTCKNKCAVGNCETDEVTCAQSGENRVCGECNAGFHNIDCTLSCAPPTGCLDSTEVYCNQTTGVVQDCGECNDGFYDRTCDQTCSVGNCIEPVKCDQPTGANRVCSQCMVGFFSTMCNETCRQGNCVAMAAVQCDQLTGEERSCSECESGWEGAETGCATAIDECATNPCNSNGKCTDLLANFTCECYEGWTNTTCNVEVHDGVSLSTKGAAYLKFDPQNKSVALPTQLQWNTLAFDFRTNQDRGVLVFARDYGLFFSVELINNHIKIQNDYTATAKLYPSGGVGLSDGEWHNVRISLIDGSAKIDQEDFEAIFDTDDDGSGIYGPTSPFAFTARNGFYLGGLSYWKEEDSWTLQSRRNFGGCMRAVEFDGRRLNMNEASVEAGAYHARENSCKRDVDRPPCADSPCDVDEDCVDLWDVHECACDPSDCADPFVVTVDSTSMVEYQFTSSDAAVATNALDVLVGFDLSFEFRTRAATVWLLSVQGTQPNPNSDHQLSIVLNGDDITIRFQFGPGEDDAQRVVVPIDSFAVGSYQRGLMHRLVLKASRSSDGELSIGGSIGIASETLQSFQFDNTTGLDGFDVADGTIMYGGRYTKQKKVEDTVDGCMQGFQINRRPLPSSEGNVDVVVTKRGGSVQENQCISADVCSETSNPCPTTLSNCLDFWNLAFCNCSRGYGPVGVCDTNIDDCAKDPCLNNGACTDLVDGFVCNCDGTGWQGDTCTIPVDDCAGVPCQRGNCVDEFKTYRCECPRPYTGTHCGQDINECAVDPCDVTEFCSQLSPPNCMDETDQEQCDNWVGYTCANITECVVGHTFEVFSPLRSADRMCNQTQTCNDTVQFESVAATYTADRRCSTISPMCKEVDLQYESLTPTPYSDRECTTCSQCDGGDTFVAANCTALTNTRCSNCTKCATSTFMSSDCEEYVDRQCTDPKVCDVAMEYVQTDYTTTTDRVCGIATLCVDYQFESVGLQLAADRICTNTSMCNFDAQFQQAPQTTTTDRDCVNCGSCLFGEYISVVCSNTSDVECQPCTCQNGGRCFPSLTQGYFCECPNLFYGDSCEKVDPCDEWWMNVSVDGWDTMSPEAVPCLNNGVCINDRVNDTYTCECDVFHDGARCESIVCSSTTNPCESIPNTDGCLDSSCLCLPGYHGTFCDSVETACQPNPCQNGGSCDDTQLDIDIDINVDGMGNNSADESDRTQPGETGSSPPTAAPGFRRARRQGLDFTCTCPVTFSGTTCNIAVAPSPSPTTEPQGLNSQATTGAGLTALAVIAGVALFGLIVVLIVMSRQSTIGHAEFNDENLHAIENVSVDLGKKDDVSTQETNLDDDELHFSRAQRTASYRAGIQSQPRSEQLSTRVQSDDNRDGIYDNVDPTRDDEYQRNSHDVQRTASLQRTASYRAVIQS